MRCSDCREWLDDYARHLLSPAQAEKMAAHLAECPACTDDYESLKSLLVVLQAEPEQRIDQAELADFLPNVWEKIDNGVTKSYKGWLYKLVPSLAAAAILAFIIFKPAIQTMTDYQVNRGEITDYSENNYYSSVNLSYSDDEIYTESNYYAIIKQLLANNTTEILDTLESELDYEITMFSDYQYTLDDLSDEALEYMNEKLNKLYNSEG